MLGKRRQNKKSEQAFSGKAHMLKIAANAAASAINTPFFPKILATVISPPLMNSPK